MFRGVLVAPLLHNCTNHWGWDLGRCFPKWISHAFEPVACNRASERLIGELLRSKMPCTDWWAGVRHRSRKAALELLLGRRKEEDAKEDATLESARAIEQRRKAEAAARRPPPPPCAPRRRRPVAAASWGSRMICRCCIPDTR